MITVSFVHTKPEYCTGKDFGTRASVPTWSTSTELPSSGLAVDSLPNLPTWCVRCPYLNRWCEWVNRSKRKSGNPMNWSLLYYQWTRIYIYIHTYIHIISYIMICSQIQSETCKLRTSTPVRDCGGSFVPKHHPELQIGVQDTVMSRISTWHF